MLCTFRLAHFETLPALPAVCDVRRVLFCSHFPHSAQAEVDAIIPELRAAIRDHAVSVLLLGLGIRYFSWPGEGWFTLDRRPSCCNRRCASSQSGSRSDS